MNRKPTILHLPRWYPSDVDLQNGIFVQKHIESISSFAKCIVVYCQSDPSQLSRLRSSLHTKSDFPTVIVYYKPFGILTPVIYLLAFFSALKKGLGLGRPDIVHVHMGFRTFVVGCLVKLYYGAPLIISDHWSGYRRGIYAGFPPLRKKIIKYIVRKSSALTAVSQSLISDMKQVKLQSEKQNVVIPNIISTPSAFSINVNQIPTILCIADLRDDIKNISGILRATATFNTDDFKLQIGGWGNDAIMLKKLAKNLGLDANVHFLGTLTNKEVFEALANCQFFVSNSRTETFGMIPLEAMACGKPVVCTKSGCPPEVQNSANGIFIECDDDEALRKAITEMLNSYHTYDVALLKKAVEPYSASRVALSFKQLYADCLHKNAKF